MRARNHQDTAKYYHKPYKGRALVVTAWLGLAIVLLLGALVAKGAIGDKNSLVPGFLFLASMSVLVCGLVLDEILLNTLPPARKTWLDAWRQVELDCERRADWPGMYEAQRVLGTRSGQDRSTR